jgi:hypothetical protein
MCQICIGEDGFDKHFCGDRHGPNYDAWCETCLAEVAAFLNPPPDDDPDQTFFPFVEIEEAEDRPCWSFSQITSVATN